MSDETYDVDLSNLDLTADEPIEGFDPEAEFDKPFTPLDDGVHTLRLAVSENKPKIQAKNVPDGNGNHRTEYMLFITGKANEPGTPHDGKNADDILSTYLRDGSCSAANFLKKVGKLESAQLGRMGKGAMIAKVFEIVSGNPTVQAETQWQAQLDEEDSRGRKKRLKGQKRFPKDAKGNAVPLREDPVTGGEVFTRASIVRYLG